MNLKEKKIFLNKNCTYYNLANGLKLWIHHSYHWLTQEALQVAINENPKFYIKKNTSRRKIDTEIYSSATENLLVKVFKFSKIKDMYWVEKKAYRNSYALSEFYNSWKAKELGVNVPNCYAYFEVSALGFVKECGVIQEFISDGKTISDVSMSKEDQLHRVTPLILSLFFKGVNHIDISPYNILIKNLYDHKEKYYILDWQYCSFQSGCIETLLIMYAFRYLKYLKLNSNNPIAKDWLEFLYTQSSIKIPKELFLEKVKRLEGTKLHLKHRLELDSKGLGLK